MTEKWLIALDIDGTLIYENGGHSEHVFQTVREVAERGHEVMIATGRGWSITNKIIEQVGILPEYVICANGAVTMAREGADSLEGYKQWHAQTFFAESAINQLVAEFSDAYFMVEDLEGRRFFTKAWEFAGEGTEVSIDELKRVPATRVVLFDPGTEHNEFLARVEALGLHSVSYFIGYANWVDIAPEGVSKGDALKRVIDQLQIPSSRIFCAGDGRNDIEMFEVAGNGGVAVAMGQAPEELLAVATEVTAHVDDDGLALALQRFLD